MNGNFSPVSFLSSISQNTFSYGPLGRQEPVSPNEYKNSDSYALPLILEAILAADRDTPLCRHLLAPFFDALAEELRAETAAGRLSRREQEWKRLQEYITLNLARDIGRDEIAAAAGLQPATVSRRIRSQSGMTLREYLNAARLSYARCLLAETELTIEEIARQSGYRYASYFIRAYRKAFGSSPGAERAATH